MFPFFLVPVGAVGVGSAPLELGPLDGNEALAALDNWQYMWEWGV